MGRCIPKLLKPVIMTDTIKLLRIIGLILVVSASIAAILDNDNLTILLLWFYAMSVSIERIIKPE